MQLRNIKQVIVESVLVYKFIMAPPIHMGRLYKQIDTAFYVCFFIVSCNGAILLSMIVTQFVLTTPLIHILYFLDSSSFLLSCICHFCMCLLRSSR